MRSSETLWNRRPFADHENAREGFDACVTRFAFRVFYRLSRIAYRVSRSHRGASTSAGGAVRVRLHLRTALFDHDLSGGANVRSIVAATNGASSRAVCERRISALASRNGCPALLTGLALPGGRLWIRGALGAAPSGATAGLGNDERRREHRHQSHGKETTHARKRPAKACEVIKAAKAAKAAKSQLRKVHRSRGRQGGCGVPPARGADIAKFRRACSLTRRRSVPCGRRPFPIVRPT